MQVNIIIATETHASKKINTTISYVNPQATNQQLLELATALNNFTDNIYLKTSKETKEDL